MRYRLFISDFDGTLVRADGTISQANRRAIEAYRADGGIFAVCTGRMPAAIVPRLKELGLREGPVVAYQGATVLDIATGELLKDEGFAPQDALRILSVLEEKDLHIHAYTVDALYCNRRDAALKAYERVCGVQANVSEHEPLSALFARTGMRTVKLLAMVRPEQRVALMNELRTRLGAAFYVTCSADMLVEIMPAGQSKASAVDFLCAYYGISLAQTAAIGDQLNDLPMLGRAGGKFAVANAERELREIAVVVPSVEEDGVAYALQHYAMGELR